MKNNPFRAVASLARSRTVSLVAAAMLGLPTSGAAMSAEAVTGQGNSIAFSDVQTVGGMRMIMGAVENQSWDGGAVFFKRNSDTGGWIQVKAIKSSAPGATENFGSSVSMSGDGNIAVVGARNGNSYAGLAYVYNFVDNTWTKGPSLKGKDVIGYPSQGASVFINYDGNTIFVGGPGDNSGKGAVWVYTLNKGEWKQQAKLVPTVTTPGAATLFGSSISSTWDGNRVVIGAPYDSNRLGAVWIFERKDGKWGPSGSKIVTTGGTGVNMQQGTSVAMAKDGNLFVVGSPGDDASKGSAAIFVRQSSGAWIQKKRLAAPNVERSSLFGSSVAVSARGGLIAVGEPNILINSRYGEISTYSGTPTTDYTAMPIIDNPPCSYVGKSIAVSAGADFMFAGGPGTPPGVPTRGAACFFQKESGKWVLKESPVAYK